jgi:predicted nucleic acid-binding protein
MKNLLIDTNIYTHALAGDPETTDILRHTQKIAICSISIGELLSGFKGGTREKENRKELEEFLDAGAADKAAIQRVKVPPYQLLVSDT